MKQNFFELKITDKSYPDMLNQIGAGPKILFCKGDISALSKHAIAIVGSRRCTDYGLDITAQIIQSISDYDVSIVSGLAKGIDTQAHKCALEYQLPTIAVLGSGLNNIYPHQNISLAEEITKTGLIISEFPYATPPAKYHFPMRNRIISGLSFMVIVVEAGEKSGALITAKMALDQGREVFAVPGDMDRNSVKGNNILIKQGSAMAIADITDIRDFLDECPYKIPKKNTGFINTAKTSFSEKPNKTNKRHSNNSTLSPGKEFQGNMFEVQVLNQFVGRRSISFDMIMKKQTDISTNELMAILSILEIRGYVKQIGGDNYIRIKN